MKVKRYVVNAVPEALPMIRSELGADAVILNTKEIRVGGIFGMFGKKKMEVIAAAEAGSGTGKPSAAAGRPAAARTPGPSAAQAALAQAVSSASRRTAAEETAAADDLRAGGQQPTVAPRRPAAGAATGLPAVGEQAAGLGVATAAPPSPQAQPIQQPPAKLAAALEASFSPQAAGKPRTRDSELLDEIRDMKMWIVKMSKQQQLETWPEPIRELYDRLADQEIEAKWIDKLIGEVEEALSADSRPIDRESVRDAAEKALIGWLEGFEGKGIGDSTRVIHFVGPTGVGKTTSIAKLAAEMTLKAGRKVGFVTSDTYRIAAVDQLRTYATILNVPLEVVFSPAEVARAFRQLEGRDLIFMDTAGRNFRNELYVSEVNSLLQSGGLSETYLVLSLTGKYKDMAAVAGHFSKYGVERAVFTKQDETSAYGAILNLAMDQGLVPAYIAYGQTVPDDIAPFRADRYVRQVLGASADE